MLGIPNYLYRLLPANPILLRVVELGGKRKRDLAVRCIYLGLLTAIVLLSIAFGSDRYTGEVSFSALTKVSGRIFQQMSYVQLALVALLAPVFTAGAITQEKDSQTYDILLATPLSNAQIVLGSLLSRLFFIVALLISGIPIFSITQIFGGVAISSIATSFGIAAATAFVTGALAMAIATFKVGTRRTIFSFYLAIIIFLVGGLLLDRVDAMRPVIGVETSADGTPQTDPRTGELMLIRTNTSWLTAVNPFLALRSIFGEPAYTPPDLGKLPPALQAWPLGWYFSRPHTFYIAANVAIGLLLITPSIILLRRMAQSTFSLRNWILQRLGLNKAGAAAGSRKPRVVWNNPIAWREAKTKASAARATFIRYAFILFGIGGAIFLLVQYARTVPAESFLSPGAFNSVTNQLFVQGKLRGTYKVAPSTSVSLNGEAITLERIRGSYKVVRLYPENALRARNPVTLTQIDLVDIPRQMDARTVRRYLLGLVILEFAAILLIVTNAAASTVTREKEDGTLDLLLSSPITSRYYIWGKLRGLVAFVLPLVAVPVASVLLFVMWDALRTVGGTMDQNSRWIVFPESVMILPATLIIVAAFAAIVGMQMSLRMRTTVRAVMASVALVLGACGLMGFCGFQILNSFSRGTETIGLILGSFSPFTVMTLLIDPYTMAGNSFSGQPAEIATNRLIIFIFSLIATGAYAAGVYGMYVSMVKNFDMTIRRQSR